jgi:hypothetical protein
MLVAIRSALALDRRGGAARDRGRGWHGAARSTLASSAGMGQLGEVEVLAGAVG